MHPQSPFLHRLLCPLPLLVFLAVLFAARLAEAQEATFNFTLFREDAVDESLRECSTVRIKLGPTINGTYDAVPPFYIVSADVGGVTAIDALHGEEVSGGTLTWDAVRHAPGANLFVYLVDSIGSMGTVGFVPVINGSSSNCRPTVPYTPINMTLDKYQVAVCDSLLISISGGTKPYTLTIIGQGAQPFQNVTMGPEDDSYEFVNRNGPGEAMVFIASDSSGQWSHCSMFVFPIAPDATCDGRESRSFQSAASGGPLPHSSNQSKRAIAGGVVGGIVLLLALILAAFAFNRRQKSVRLRKGERINLARDEATPLVEGEAIPFVMPDRRSRIGPTVARTDGSARAVRNDDSLSASSMVENQPLANSISLVHPVHGGTKQMSSTTLDTGLQIVRDAPRTIGDRPDSHLPITTDREQRRGLANTQNRSTMGHWDVEELYELPPAYREWSRRQ